MRVFACLIALNEDLYIEEWVIYYRYGLGFDHLYVFDNSADNSLQSLLERFADFVTVIHYPGRKVQMEVYNRFLNSFLEPDTWVAFFDTDEFLVLKKHETIKDLVAAYSTHGGIVINWRLFGDSGKANYEPEPVTFRFLKGQTGVDVSCKSIVCIDRVEYMITPHHARYKDGYKGVDTNGIRVWDSRNPNGPADVAVLHHYFGKTREEFQKKRLRGRATTDRVRSDEEFDAHNKNDGFDDSAKKVYEKALAKLNGTSLSMTGMTYSPVDIDIKKTASYSMPKGTQIAIIVMSVVFLVCTVLAIYLAALNIK